MFDPAQQSIVNKKLNFNFNLSAPSGKGEITGEITGGCLRLRSPQNIMGSQTPEDTGFSLLLKGKSVSLGNSSFPNTSRIPHLFEVKGRMALTAEEKLEFLVHHLLQIPGQGQIVPYKTFREKKFMLLHA
jgi:hypothetical protein